MVIYGWMVGIWLEIMYYVFITITHNLFKKAILFYTIYFLLKYLEWFFRPDENFHIYLF